jgi:transcriptional regulator with XRE-family HTH domain
MASRPTGLDLQFRRKERGLTQDQVAAAMGVVRQRVAAIEGARLPSPGASAAYLAALKSTGGPKPTAAVIDTTDHERVDALLGPAVDVDELLEAVRELAAAGAT